MAMNVDNCIIKLILGISNCSLTVRIKFGMVDPVTKTLS